MTFDRIFEFIERLAAQNSSTLSSVDDISANIHITGSSPGTIGAVLKNGRLTVQNSAVTPFDAQVTATADDLMALMSGGLNPMMAVMSGRIKISGDMGKLMKIMAQFKK